MLTPDQGQISIAFSFESLSIAVGLTRQVMLSFRYKESRPQYRKGKASLALTAI
jgi:hypothetical protein